MTNEKKALQLAGLKEISEEERYYQSSKCEIYDKCLKMAIWKEQQMIDKAVEWLESVNLDYYQIREGVFSRELIEDFRKEMEK